MRALGYFVLKSFNYKIDEIYSLFIVQKTVKIKYKIYISAINYEFHQSPRYHFLGRNVPDAPNVYTTNCIPNSTLHPNCILLTHTKSIFTNVYNLMSTLSIFLFLLSTIK